MTTDWMIAAVDWMATYLVHSTLLLLPAAAAARWLRARPALASAVWKTALVGGVATATLQTSGVVEPLAGRFSIMSEETGPIAAAHVAPVEELAFDRAITEEAVDLVEVSAAGVAIPIDLAVAPVIVEEVAPAPAPEPSAPRDWRPIVALVWLLGVTLSLTRFAGVWLRLARRLRTRRTVRGGGVYELLARLCGAVGLRKPVRLTCTPAIAVPLASGVLRPEICIPRRSVRGLSPRSQEALLAHELAHVLRRDPLWRLVGGLIESVLFFQPLNRLATRELAICSEYLCDAWAAARTGRPLALAQCLTEVAQWMTPTSYRSPLPAMASRQPSLLRQRVERLLAADPSRLQGRRGARVGAGLVGLSMFVAVALVAPGAMGSLRGPALAGDCLEPAAPAIAFDASARPGVVPAIFDGAAVDEAAIVLAAAAPDERTRRRQNRDIKSKQKQLDRRLSKAEKHAKKQRRLEADVDDSVRALKAATEGADMTEDVRERYANSVRRARELDGMVRDSERELARRRPAIVMGGELDRALEEMEREVEALQRAWRDELDRGGDRITLHITGDGDVLWVDGDGRRHELRGRDGVYVFPEGAAFDDATRKRIREQAAREREQARRARSEAGRARHEAERAREQARRIRDQARREAERARARSRAIEQQLRRKGIHQFGDAEREALQRELEKLRDLRPLLDQDALRELREEARKLQREGQQLGEAEQRALREEAARLRREGRIGADELRALRREAERLQREAGRGDTARARELEQQTRDRAKQLEQQARERAKELEQRARELEQRKDSGKRGKKKRAPTKTGMRSVQIEVDFGALAPANLELPSRRQPCSDAARS
ncbi:MAG: hypothetical protein KC636_19490 [Myxococcales bacterium]|nr:hypothetical protein [Myxococcales bacterium]